MNTRITKLLTLENNLRMAIENNELSLHYQPLFDLKTNTIFGAEALLRWQHPEMGHISPLDFIPLAEETGLIVPIGEWVIKTACKQNKKWQNMGIPPIKVSINVSGRQLQHVNIAKLLRKICDKNKLSLQHVEIELTESILMDNPEEMVKMLNEIKKMHTTIAIDDFGTGYSSLSYLRHFPVDKLKIDQTFVRDLTKHSDDRAIVLAIIAMAKSLGLNVLAEGIETKNQAKFLKENQCDYGQGYYYSKPIPADEFTKLLKSHKKILKPRAKVKSKTRIRRKVKAKPSRTTSTKSTR